MPVNAEDGGAYRLLDMFAHPPDGDRGMEREREGGRVNDETVRQADGLHARLPIIFFLKVADGDEASTTTNSKLVFCK